MKLMVIDGNSIINRAFYGIRLLTTRDGTPTNGVYGFLTILGKLLGEDAPDALCVTFDLSGPTFRHEQYEGYKAQRKGMPDELAVQMPILKEVLDAMNIPRYELAGWEADDLIGTIARRCEAAGCECVIVTGDKDSLQLVTETTRVRHVKTRMGQTETTDYTPAVFFEEYGFEPYKMVDLKALMGDASDNIPGVPGVGEKTAMDLVRRLGTVEAIYANLDTPEIKDAVRKRLAAGADAAKLSYELATIRTDADIPFSPADNVRRPVDNDALYALFEKLEFHRLTEKFGLTPPGGAPAQPAAAECTSVTVKTPEDVSAMITALGETESVGVRFSGDFGLCVLVTGANTAYVLRRGAMEDFDRALRGVLSSGIGLIGHDVKDTMRRLLEMDMPLGSWVFDTALAAYLLEPTDSTYDISRLCERYCGFRPNTPGEAADGQLSLLEDWVSELAQLTSEAAALSLLKDALLEQLEALHIGRLYYEMELPLCPVLAEMEHAGFQIDRKALSDFGEMLSGRIAALETQIYDLSGEQFNINSPKQLGTVLFERLMLPAPKRTKTGYSTNIDVLESLRGKHGVIDLLIEYRQLAKLKSTYADGLLKVIGSDGRVRTSFQMTVTATGRLSSTEPNLQNIPVRTELGSEIRKMFVAGEGNVLVDADYSQIELRLLAHISGDARMLAAFESGEDIHTVTASQVFGVPVGGVTSLMRSRAKAVNFGIVYGISAFSLGADVGVSTSEAKQYIDSYLEKYSGVAAYMQEIMARAKRDGFVETLYGRRRNLPELKSGNYNMRAFGERVALNMPIQGTAADVMKLAMLRAAKSFREAGLSARLILQVHDELIAECPEAEAETVSRLLREAMEGAAQLSVRLTVDVSTGKSWHDAK